MNYYIFQVKNAFDDFKRNKMRTLLASLGILIGVMSVVMLIALGLGLKNYIKGQFEDMGTNLIMIMPGSGLSQGLSGISGGLAGGAEFDERDLNNLKKVSKAESVIPVFMKGAIIETGENEEYGYIIGTTEEMFDLMGMEPIAGELFDKSSVQSRSKDVVLGYNLAKSLFDDVPEDAVGRTVRTNNQRFKVIGVTDKSGDNEMDNSMTISYKTTFGSFNPNKTFFALYLGVEDEDDVEAVKAEAEERLLTRYDEDDFDIADQEELLEVVNQIFNVLNSVLIAIGSISLVVGGIGIMNIMYANVTERTKEIGIRRAIGATKQDILLQFLAESLMLSLFGGVMGLLISTIIVVLVNPFFPIALNALAVALAIGISSGIGIFFGVFPARRAANLTPIEAIRYE